MSPDAVGDAAVWKIRLMVRLEPLCVKLWIKGGNENLLSTFDRILW